MHVGEAARKPLGGARVHLEEEVLEHWCEVLQRARGQWGDRGWRGMRRYGVRRGGREGGGDKAGRQCACGEEVAEGEAGTARWEGATGWPNECC